MKSWKEYKKRQIRTIIFFALLALCLVLFSNFLIADEMVFKFKSPSFSGINTLQHYLTIENQQFSRNQAIKDAKQAAIEEAERDADRDWETLGDLNLNTI